MHIGLIAANVFRSDQGLVSDHASTRLRAIIPGRTMARAGHRVSFFAEDRLDGDIESGQLFRPDVLVVHKCRHDISRHLDAARDRGARVVLDICDHVFQLESLAEHYPALLRRADAVTVPTEAMAEVVRAAADLPVTVIPDALEGTRGGIGQVPAEPAVRFLWFGRVQNLMPLLTEMPDLARVGPARLEVMTNPHPKAVALLRSRCPAGIELEISSWSLDGIETALDRSDLVLMPSDPGEVHQVKSANRLERAFWAGRMVAGQASRALEPYRDLAYLRGGLAEAVAAARSDGAAWPDRLRQAQERLAETRAAEPVTRLWLAAITAAQGPTRNPGPSTGIG